jgi:hypothetical protein
VGNYEQPVLREDQDNLSWAIDFLVQGHVKAAAVYTRTKFEQVLKNACERLGVNIPFAINPRSVTANDLWSGLLAHNTVRLPEPKSFTKDGVTYLVRPRPLADRTIDTELQRRVTHALSWVLNPLSHSETVERYRAEIEEAIFTIDDLEQRIRQVALQQETVLVFERSELLQLLARKPEPPPTPASP